MAAPGKRNNRAWRLETFGMSRLLRQPVRPNGAAKPRPDDPWRSLNRALWRFGPRPAREAAMRERAPHRRDCSSPRRRNNRRTRGAQAAVWREGGDSAPGDPQISMRDALARLQSDGVSETGGPQMSWRQGRHQAPGNAWVGHR